MNYTASPFLWKQWLYKHLPPKALCHCSSASQLYICCRSKVFINSIVYYETQSTWPRGSHHSSENRISNVCVYATLITLHRLEKKPHMLWVKPCCFLQLSLFLHWRSFFFVFPHNSMFCWTIKTIVLCLIINLSNVDAWCMFIKKKPTELKQTTLLGALGSFKYMTLSKFSNKFIFCSEAEDQEITYLAV